MRRLTTMTALATAATLLFGCNESDSSSTPITPTSPELAPLVASAAVPAPVGGVGDAAFYVDGELFRTVGTPTTLPQNAPDKSFDTIYDLSAYQDFNVATAGPGDADYNGGRWRVHAISFTDYAAALATYDTNDSGDFDSDEEVEAAIEGGAAVDTGVVASFTCPVIPFPEGGA
jgi:hypothetical protein